MRARNIKPGFFKNELLAEMQPMVRLLFIGIWTLADREGRVEDRPKRIKLELAPYDDFDAEQALCDLAAAGFIDRYQADGASVIQIVNFLKHQSPHGTEKDSALPDKDGLYTLHERGKSGCVTGNKRSDNVKTGRNNVSPPLSNGSDTVTTPFRNGGPIVKERPDSPNPDSPNPELKSSPSDSSPDNPGDTSGQVVRMADRDGVPYTEFAELYNEVCGELFPQAAKLTDKRRKRIRALWKTDTKNQKDKLRTDNIGYWRRYFEHCCAVEFFTKERNGTGHETWRPNFDFLISEKCYIGVLEGKYV